MHFLYVSGFVFALAFAHDIRHQILAMSPPFATPNYQSHGREWSAARNGQEQSPGKVLERSCSYPSPVLVITEYTPWHKIVQSFYFKTSECKKEKKSRARGKDPVRTTEECPPIITTTNKNTQRIKTLSSIGYIQWEHDKESTCVSSNKVVCMFGTHSLSPWWW